MLRTYFHVKYAEGYILIFLYSTFLNSTYNCSGKLKKKSKIVTSQFLIILIMFSDVSKKSYLP